MMSGWSALRTTLTAAAAAGATGGALGAAFYGGNVAQGALIGAGVSMALAAASYGVGQAVRAARGGGETTTDPKVGGPVEKASRELNTDLGQVEEQFANPTGGELRGEDPANFGSGEYGARRTRNGIPVKGGHPGVDITSEPNQNVVTPIEGKIRVIQGKYKGFETTNSYYKVKVLYNEVDVSLLPADKLVGKGVAIGRAQDIRPIYGMRNGYQITNHVHVEVRVQINGAWRRVDPTPFFKGIR
jgi:hypothetical protein